MARTRGGVPLRILSVIEGPFARRLIRQCQHEGVSFCDSWEDLSRFIAFVNEGWRLDPAADSGWFPPRVFDGVRKLHLPRTLTTLAIAAYFAKARGLRPEAFHERSLSFSSNCYGAIHWQGEPVALQEGGGPAQVFTEFMYIYRPPPLTAGSEKAVLECYGLQPFQPGVGMANLVAFSRGSWDIQGFSLPFLERDGLLLPVLMDEFPSPGVVERFFREPLNPTRIQGHLDRFYEIFDMPEPLTRSWACAAVSMLRRLLSDGTVWGPQA